MRRRTNGDDAPVGLGRRGRRLVLGAPRSSVGRSAVNLAFAAHALSVLAVIEVGLRRSTLDRLCDRLGIRLSRGAPPVGTAGHGEVPWAELHRAAARGTRVLRWWPFEATCLRRCLLWGALLRDHEPTLVVGVRRDETGAIAAHSWLVLAGRSVDPDSESFASFAMP